MPRRFSSPFQFPILSRLAGVLVLALLLVGCSLPRFFKSDDSKKSIETTLRHDLESGKLTQAGLQAEVMSFSDEYVLTIKDIIEIG